MTLRAAVRNLGWMLAEVPKTLDSMLTRRGVQRSFEQMQWPERLAAVEEEQEVFEPYSLDAVHEMHRKLWDERPDPLEMFDRIKAEAAEPAHLSWAVDGATTNTYCNGCGGGYPGDHTCLRDSPAASAATPSPASSVAGEGPSAVCGSPQPPANNSTNQNQLNLRCLDRFGCDHSTRGDWDWQDWSLHVAPILAAHLETALLTEFPKAGQQ